MRTFAGRDDGNEQDAGHLIRQILSRYHSAHRRDLPQLCALARRVESHHAYDPNAPHGLTDLLQRIWSELEGHMRREERFLFPSMLRKAAGLDNSLAETRKQHARQAGRLRQIAWLTHGFTPPEGACPDWWKLYALTFSFVDDLDEHMQLENEVLFPSFELRPS